MIRGHVPQQTLPSILGEVGSMATLLGKANP